MMDQKHQHPSTNSDKSRANIQRSSNSQSSNIMDSSLFSADPQKGDEKMTSGGVEFSLAPSEGERAGVRGQTAMTKPASKCWGRNQNKIREPSPLPSLSPHPQSLSPSEGAREAGVAASVQSVAPTKTAKNHILCAKSFGCRRLEFLWMFTRDLSELDVGAWSFST